MIGMEILTFLNFNTRMESFFSSFLIQYPVWKNSAKELSAAVHSVDDFVYKNMFISMTWYKWELIKHTLLLRKERKTENNCCVTVTLVGGVTLSKLNGKLDCDVCDGVIYIRLRPGLRQGLLSHMHRCIHGTIYSLAKVVWTIVPYWGRWQCDMHVDKPHIWKISPGVLSRT